jgi:hypothetical protein
MVAKEIFKIHDFAMEDPYEVCIEVAKEADVIEVIRVLKKAKDDGLINFKWGISFTLTAINDEAKSAGIVYPKI